MAFQLVWWCLTHEAETEDERNERQMMEDLDNYSPYLSDEANAIFHRMKFDSSRRFCKLAYYKVGDEATVDILRALRVNTHLQKLDLSHNIISDGACVAMADFVSMNTTLQELNLSYNRIADEGAVGLATMLRRNTTLQTINLYKNTISDEGAADIAQAFDFAVYEAMKGGKATASSTSGGDKASESNPDDHRSMCTGANIPEQANDTLQALMLGHNALTDVAAQRFSTALRTNRGLQILDLCHNNIADAGAECIAVCLETNATLQQINLGHNAITSDGCAALCRSLRSNVKLTVLDLFANRVNDSAKDAIMEAIRGNTVLINLNLGENLLSMDAMQELEKARVEVKETSALKVFNFHQNQRWEEECRGYLNLLLTKGETPHLAYVCMIQQMTFF
eukprot:PhM_4_TR19119/c0_g1_i1/m.81011